MSDTPSSALQIKPLLYQSHQTPFTEWVTLLTLCLAPLIAHIVAGVPRTSPLCSHRPKWHQYLCHFNPTSILWRYAAITDRRIRANTWDRADLAAANTLFWTAQGWDGSEAMVSESLTFCSHLPEHGRVSLASREMVKTVIVTLQGVQASILLTGVLTNVYGADFPVWLGVDAIFFPLAFIGLLRLTCGFWLTDDYAYSAPRIQDYQDPLRRGLAEAALSLDSLHEAPSTPRARGDEPRSDPYRKPSFWLARAFRAVYLLPIIGVWIITILYLRQALQLTTTAFLTLLFHFVLLGATAVICAFYFARDRTTSTVIPCISARWYQAYSALLGVFMLALFVVACVETRRTACGKYTSGPPYTGEINACRVGGMDLVVLGEEGRILAENPDIPLDAVGFGITTSAGGAVTPPGSFLVYNFTGTCLGSVLLSSGRRISPPPGRQQQ